MAERTTKQLNRTCLAVVMVVSLACGYLAVHQVMKKDRQFGIEKDILSKKINELNLATGNLKDLKAALAETKQKLDYLNERIPKSGKIGLFLKQINALIKQRMITMVSLEPLPASEEKIYLKNPIKLLFSGNFVDVYHFIRDLEEMHRVVVMKQLAITKQKDTDFCRVELMINVFEQKKDLP